LGELHHFQPLSTHHFLQSEPRFPLLPRRKAASAPAVGLRWDWWLRGAAAWIRGGETWCFTGLSQKSKPIINGT